MIYCNLGHTQLNKRLSEFGIYKNSSGYYKREDLDRMMSGTDIDFRERAARLKVG